MVQESPEDVIIYSEKHVTNERYGGTPSIFPFKALSEKPFDTSKVPNMRSHAISAAKSPLFFHEEE